MPLFLTDEYLERLDKAKQRMAAAGIDVLVSAAPANMNSRTGYDGWSFYVPHCDVDSLDADTPLSIGRRMDAERGIPPFCPNPISSDTRKTTFRPWRGIL